MKVNEANVVQAMSTPHTFMDLSGAFGTLGALGFLFPPFSAAMFGVSEGLAGMAAGITCFSEGLDAACGDELGAVGGGALFAVGGKFVAFMSPNPLSMSTKFFQSGGLGNVALSGMCIINWVKNGSC